MEKILFHATSMILLILINGIEFSRDKDTCLQGENKLRECLEKCFTRKARQDFGRKSEA